MDDDNALAEFTRRIKSGEIKRKKYTLEQIKEMAERARQKAL